MISMPTVSDLSDTSAEGEVERSAPTTLGVSISLIWLISMHIKKNTGGLLLIDYGYNEKNGANRKS